MGNNKQPIKVVNPLFIRGTNSFLGLNPFVASASNVPVLKIDTEARFEQKKKTDLEIEEG